MALTVVDMFYSTSGAQTASGSPRYASDENVTGTFIPFGLAQLNNLALVERVVSASTSGDTVDDYIIAEFAAYHFDNYFGTFQIDPDTGQPENRHWESAMRVLLSKYGILGPNMQLIAPLYAEEDKASSLLVRVDASSDAADSEKPDL